MHSNQQREDQLPQMDMPGLDDDEPAGVRMDTIAVTEPTEVQAGAMHGVWLFLSTTPFLLASFFVVVYIDTSGLS